MFCCFLSIVYLSFWFKNYYNCWCPFYLRACFYSYYRAYFINKNWYTLFSKKLVYTILLFSYFTSNLIINFNSTWLSKALSNIGWVTILTTHWIKCRWLNWCLCKLSLLPGILLCIIWSLFRNNWLLRLLILSLCKEIFVHWYLNF